MKKVQSILSVIVFAVLVISCKSQKNELSFDSNNLKQRQLGDTITLQKGDTAMFGQQHFKIIFTKMISDSRCPKGVVCIWAGDAQGEFKFISNSTSETFDLSTGGQPTATHSIIIEGYTIKLVDYLPYPDISQKIPPIPSAKIVVSQQP